VVAMGLEGEPISPELVLVSPELRRLALQQLVEAAEQDERGLPAPRAEPTPEPSPKARRPVLASVFSKARKTGRVIAFCAVEVVIVVAAVVLVKVIVG
jgi:hypothetical protein